jgi:beta-lactamase regulating signal transducer with metallopeptidase domain
MTNALTDAVLSPALAGHPLIEKLGWVLLHFLWEGALVAGVLALALALMRRRPPEERYAVSLAALALMAVLPLATWWTLAPAAPSSAPPAPVASAHASVPARVHARRLEGSATVFRVPAPLSASPSAPLSPSAARPQGESGPATVMSDWMRRRAEQSAPLVALGWLAGVVLLALRTAGGWSYVLRLRRDATPAPERWQQRFCRLAREAGLGLSHMPRLLVSGRAEGPAAVGWWRPAVLVPTGFLTGLPPEQVEAILRHELAHIRRHDYFTGLAQALVETMLFYHPAVWWVSGRVRVLREHCCDDAAAGAEGRERLTYARALAALADWRSTAPFAPAGSGGSLLDRIRRVTGRRAHGGRPDLWPAVAALGALLVLGACAAGSVAGSESTEGGSTAGGQGHAGTRGEPADSSRAPRSALPSAATAHADTTPRVRVYATKRDTMSQVRVLTARGNTVIADTVHANLHLFRGGAAADSLLTHRSKRLERFLSFDRPSLDSLTVFSLNKADSTLTRADSMLTRLNVRFDSMGTRFPDPQAFDSLRVHIERSANSLRKVVPFDLDSLADVRVQVYGGGNGGWSVSRADTIPTGWAAQAERRALKQTAERLDARADALEEGGRDEAARALREEVARLREQRGREHHERLRKHRRSVKEHRERLREHRLRMEDHRERLQAHRERVREQRMRAEEKSARIEAAERNASAQQREALREQASALRDRAERQQARAKALRERGEALREAKGPPARVEALRARAEALEESVLELRRRSRVLKRRADRPEREAEDQREDGDQWQFIE